MRAPAPLVGVLLSLLVVFLCVPRLRAEPPPEPPPGGSASSGSPAEPSPGALSAAAPAPQHPIPDDAALVAQGAVIGRILIRAHDIFNTDLPEENRRVFRWANRLHRRTRDRVIRRLLLFRPGEPYDPRRLQESERILRSRPYLYDAQIRPVRYEDGRVDVLVETRDVWTLQVGLRFGRAGGENSTGFGLQDSNFMGWGKDLTLRRTRDVDRTRFLYRYKDPNLFGSWVQLQAWFSDNSDGSLKWLEVAQPFYALDTPWAAGGSGLGETRVDPLYNLGEVRQEFEHRIRRYEAFWGRGFRARSDRVHRWKFGFTFDDHRFAPTAGTDPALGVPENRSLAYPWVEFERLDDAFAEVHNLDRLHRTEDLNLGHHLVARFGVSGSVFGADRNQALLDVTHAVGRSMAPGKLLLSETYLSGRFGGPRGHENVLAGGKVRYYWRNWEPHLFFVRLELDAASRLDGEVQLLLGGDTGLRGYPLRYQAGDRRALLTIEQRFFTSWHLLRLAYVGAAVFVDFGKAWFHEGADPDHLGLLKDVGFGLRFGSSRSSNASVLHVDVAFPLDGPDSIRGVQLLVTTRETF